MECAMVAELLFGLLANGILYFAISRYINFFVSMEKCRWNHSWILYIAACTGTYAIGVIFLSPGLNIAVNLLAIFLLILPYQITLSKKLLIVFTIDAVTVLTDILVVQLLTRYVPGQPVDYIFQLILSLLVLMTTVFLRDPDDYEKDTLLPTINIVVLGMIPLVSIICIYSVAILTRNNKPVLLTVAFSLIFIISFLLLLYHALMKFYFGQRRVKRLEQMVAVYKNEIDIMQKSQEYIKKLRHDMKHHLIELSAMAQQDENAEMVRYLEKMKEFMLNPDEKVSCGNAEIDGVLNYLLRQAEEVLKTVNVDVQVPKQLYTGKFNICVILGNLVDNAVRESGKSDEKYLSVKVRAQKNVLLILIENSCDRMADKGKNRDIIRQEDASIHGLGLENVKQVVAACGGDMKIEYTENRFIVQVLLYISSVAG